MLRVKQLFQYPLKSASGFATNAFDLTERGPGLDRHWMVVDLNGNFLSQRQLPRMCLIETRLEGDQLFLNAPEMESIAVGQTEHMVDASVWKDVVAANDCGDDAANWLREFLGKPCRLVKMPSSIRRLVDTDYADGGEIVGFADGFPLLLLSQGSLDDFSEKLGRPIGAERFRPNIVIAGCEPFAEDGWRELEVDGIRLSLVKPCSRCIIPSVNPLSGVKEMEVNQALMQYRRRDGTTYFGQNALHRAAGRIAVGAKVNVIA